jgi:uncharacterized protein
MTGNLLRPTRRAFLGQSALVAASLATPTISGIAMPTYLHVASLAEAARVRFAVGNTYVIGNLYLPTDYRSTQAYPAVAVTGSLTSVKEQMAGNYAAKMAKRGIIALAIDYRNFGESGGEPRQYEDPQTKAEDLSAAVAYLATRPDVRPGAVGLLGICTSGGNVIQTASRDRNVKAVAAVAGHFSEPSGAPAFYAAMFSTGLEIVGWVPRTGEGGTGSL